MDHYSHFTDTCEELGLHPETERARLCVLCRVQHFEDVPVGYLEAWAEALGVCCGEDKGMKKERARWIRFRATCDSHNLSAPHEAANIMEACRVLDSKDVPAYLIEEAIAKMNGTFVPCETEDHFGPGDEHIRAAHEARAAYAAALGALVSFTLTTGTQSTREHLHNELRLLGEMAGTLSAPAPAAPVTHCPF